jgi:hypothetical protein
MAASDTFRVNDAMPFSPLSATASIFPAITAPTQDDVGTAWLVELGGAVPFGCDVPAPQAEERA